MAPKDLEIHQWRGKFGAKSALWISKWIFACLAAAGIARILCSNFIDASDGRPRCFRPDSLVGGSETRGDWTTEI
eukprot:4630763-Lingulodinium_polyedra.AAC.1